MGPTLLAVPVPGVGTYPHESAIPYTEVVSYPYTATVHGTPPRARRDDGYEGGLYGDGSGPTPGIATADGSSVTLPSSVYDEPQANYAGIQFSITSGANQQTVTLGSRTGTRKYSVTWTNGTPAAGVNFEARYVPAGSNSFNGEWPPVAGVGYHTLSDRPRGIVWVRGDPSGILVFSTQMYGLTFYGPGGPHIQFARHVIEVFDEDDFAAVLDGDIEGYDVEPQLSWFLELPGVTYPITTADLEYFYYPICGVTYDEANRKVYVAVKNQHSTGGNDFPVIHCLQIGGSN
jgi:hypothetical protein